MGITLDRGYWNFVKRVPKRFAHVDPRQKITRALWTDSEREARTKPRQSRQKSWPIGTRWLQAMPAMPS